MPKRTDIHSILLIGSGPIVIGQSCEFDYAGTQACKALRAEGYKVILVNSNPATIMTDLHMADVTYIEPLTLDFLTRIIEKERPDALLPTMGGQTALNLALKLHKNGVLAKYGVELLGAKADVIERAEDRELFRQTVEKLGLDLPPSYTASNLEQALEVSDFLGFPLLLRPSFTLGGEGSGIAHTKEEFILLSEKAFALSSQQHLQLDSALIGWKEFEMEVVRDKNDNCIIVCCIENIDPLGIHTGDSITVAPALTLTDKEYQKMRDASFAILRAIGVETGGSNVQFAVNPHNGRMVVIEMNPRVSRSSALASKATGFPIAKIAAKLAIGYTLPELSCEMAGDQIPASFEPSLDYTVVKIPRFHFEKFAGCKAVLGPQMHSVGEAMAIGRTFKEALLKCMRSVDIPPPPPLDKIEDLRIPGPFRLWHIFAAFKEGASLEKVHQLTHIDPWFLGQIQLAATQKESIKPVYKRIDSCAAEFSTPLGYLYATEGEECEARPSTNPKMLFLGSGPTRIGQGIEFDYSCVHAIQAFKELGYETIIINCNPETVSTDYDCADKLYLAPLAANDVLDIIALEQPEGVLLQFGGQTPLTLSEELFQAGAPLLGITPLLILQTEDREQFKQFIHAIGLKQPENKTICRIEEGRSAAEQIGYPLIVRPSFVLGGRAMSVASSAEELESCLFAAFAAAPGKPVLLERFLKNAIEVDIDAVCDGKETFIPGIMEHIEPAGIHSGDSACVVPPLRLSLVLQQELLAQTNKIALALGVVGLLNIQFAIQREEIYILEVNPRAARTIPFISKATGLDLIQIACRCLQGISLQQQGLAEMPLLPYFAVKEVVLPFHKFEGCQPLLGPEMKSTGEVMGFGKSFAEAYAKAQIAAGYGLPKAKYSLLSLNEWIGNL